MPFKPSTAAYVSCTRRPCPPFEYSVDENGISSAPWHSQGSAQRKTQLQYGAIYPFALASWLPSLCPAVLCVSPCVWRASPPREKVCHLPLRNARALDSSLSCALLYPLCTVRWQLSGKATGLTSLKGWDVSLPATPHGHGCCYRPPLFWLSA